MGFENDLFDCTISTEIQCNLCAKVLEDPVKVEYNESECHVCKKCHTHRQRNCDNQSEMTTWKPPDEQIITALESLSVKCPNLAYGCRATFPMAALETHEQCCAWRPFECRWKCGTVLALKNLRVHEECCERQTVTSDTNQMSFEDQKEENFSDDDNDNVTYNGCEDDAYGGGDITEELDDEIEVDVHRDPEEHNDMESLKGQQRFGALYRKVNDLQQNFLMFSESIEALKLKHDEDVKKLYDYSFELMQTLKTQTSQDLLEIKEQVNSGQSNSKRRSGKHCIIF